ncbi:hypothetical protein ODV28_01270 [Lactobacillus amylovorus]|uniref:hypothetical protein n=1 Tax=Lactobacillus amylovorus TaxID=1604 RepID=UPI00232F1528|nr:hypothetical protein [Lactobacillus amylovorus]MDB6235095.1 hypothetical protein [Lactobacillus amylovorus]
MENSDIKLSDDVQKLAKEKGFNIEQTQLLQKVINNRKEKENKVKELVNDNPELSSYLSELSTNLEDYHDAIDEAYGILDILQNNLILKAFYTDELNNEDLDSEMHSIKVAKHILDELRVKISDKVDAINDTTKTKEE